MSSARPPHRWTTPADIEARVRRQWQSGALLRHYAQGSTFVPLEIPLRGPTGTQLADHLDEARRWASNIQRASSDGKRFKVQETSVGGKHLGRTHIPHRVIIETAAQAWQLLGVDGQGGEVDRFTEVLRLSAHVPEAREWAIAHPLRAIELADEWPGILAARDWLEWNQGSNRYLREIDTPGADTKLVERRRSVLATMLGVSSTASGFLTDLGLASKPALVRLRCDAELLQFPEGISESWLRLDELSLLNLPVTSALIVENEITYLSAPVAEHGVVIWGRGFDVSTAGSLTWLTELSSRGKVRYWGDIDTHGFAILNRLRARLPGVQSILMDRTTLLAHEERWGTEPSPSTSALHALTDTEVALYKDLVEDRYAPALRLEQERIDWGWALERLHSETSGGRFT